MSAVAWSTIAVGRSEPISPADGPRLYLRTLGWLSIERRDRAPIIFGERLRSRLALLAIIAASGERGVARDRLLSLCWPEADTTHARGSLKQAIYVLRRQLDEPRLFNGVDVLRLDPTRIASDVSEFNTAFERGDWERAVTLYQGPFLPSIHLANGEFDDWRDAAADRLAERFRRAMAALARAADASGMIEQAVDRWRDLARLDPLSAPTAIGLMRALVRAGDPGAALRQAVTQEQLMREELGGGLDPAVAAVAAEIRATLLGSM